jgi:toxin ParE1/3/4
VRVELHPDAGVEFRSAALWYDEQRIGWGDEFISEISAALDRIGERPESFPTWPEFADRIPLIRKATIHRFPFVIAFEQHEQYVLVLAVAHAKRRPLYWLARVRP